MSPKTYFIAWQDPQARAWFPIGRLTHTGGQFRFVYTKGAEEAARKAGFHPLQSFPDFRKIHVSDSLFPLFLNRLPNSSRPDFANYVQWLNVRDDADDPLVILSRSGGRRVTDTLEVFSSPEPNDAGEYHLRFFAHGLRHFPSESNRRIAELRPGEELLVAWDLQNPRDACAVLLRTNDQHLVGYCPRYLSSDILDVYSECRGEDHARSLTVTVERVNPPPAPLQMRLLCDLTACWPKGFVPFSGPEYEPLVANGAQRLSEAG